MADHYGNHRCLVQKNVPIALILPSRWQDGAESLGMERPQAVYGNVHSIRSSKGLNCCVSLVAPLFCVNYPRVYRYI